MGWFGGSSSNDEPKVSDFSSSDEPSFSPGLDVSAAPSAPSGMGASSLQAFAAEQQQKALIQGVVSKLTQLAFDKCVSKPDTSLSSSEQSCIQAVTGKYLDGSEFVLGRLAKQQEKQSNRMLS